MNTPKNNGPAVDEKFLELSALFEISRSITASISIREILENILRIPMGQLLISRGIVLLENEKTNEYCVTEVKGMSRNLKGKCIQIDNPPDNAQLITELHSQDGWVEFFKKFDVEIILPLNTSHGVIGIIGYGSKIGNKALTDREIEFLDSLSNIAATAVANGLNVDKIRKVNRNLDRKVQQLNTIFDISQEINSTLKQHSIGSIVAFAIMGELMVNRCAVFYKEDSVFRLITSKGSSLGDVEPLSMPIITEPHFIENAKEWETVSSLGFTLIVPMRLQEHSTGVIALGPKINKSEFTETDIEFLKILGSQAAASLENVRLFNDALEKQRMEEELKLARSMQQGLLPSSLPDNEFCEFAAINIPSREVGGDYYDVVQISENSWGVAIADVVGKGAGAALLMANLQASLNVLISGKKPVSGMVQQINRLIYKNTAMDKFITFFYALVDADNNTMTFCNAGHNPPYKISASGDITELSAGGIVLGMLDNAFYNQDCVPFEPGDKIVLYTDGITEAMDEDKNEFGEERLIALLKENAECTGRELLDSIVNQVKEFQFGDVQADDITLVIAQRK